MGNLLGAPVTEKDTHVGVTDCGIEFGVSSMQGWRVHMEDAHIAEGRLYAAEVVDGNKYNIIPLPGHALFAVFDGHGGTFAASYAGKNLCRVLSRQKKFIDYAKFETERPLKEEKFTSSPERTAYMQSGLTLLQDALRDAFIEIDKEIASAFNGKKVPDADIPYNIPHQDDDGGGNNNNKNNPNSTGKDDGGGNDDQDMPDANSNNNNDDKSNQQQQQPESATPATDNALRLLEEEGDSGTTACVVVLTPRYIVCANAGDSRAVLSRLGNKAQPLSYDHKPDDDIEERRIRAAGGYVAGGRVEGDLAVSRGLGDFRFKNMSVVMSAPFSGIQPNNDSNNDGQNNNNGMNNNNVNNDPQRPTMMPGEQKVSPLPEIVVKVRNDAQDEFIIVACDGIWDVQTNHEAVQTVGDMFREGEKNLGLICEEFCDIALSMGSKDNMTALVVKLAAQKVGEGGGVTARRQLREAENEANKQEVAASN